MRASLLVLSMALAASPALAFVVPHSKPSSRSSSLNDSNNFFSTKQVTNTQKTQDYNDKHFLESSLFVATPVLAGIASFFLYPKASIWFHNSVNYLSGNNWESVDGGQLQWSILLPALNGVVMTAISLLYANLISTTGTQLRTRQITVHQSLSAEVEGIRGLIQLIQYYPEGFRQQFGDHLKGYLRMVVDELGSEVDELRSASEPLSAYRDGLHFLSVLPEHHDQSIPANILERSYETLQCIWSSRMARITSLQNRFPQLHYVTITALSTCILLVFLLETDRKVILFLDKFQISLVWGLLVGTITAIYCIGIDLAYPFIGTYTVPAEQLLDENDAILSMISETASPKLPTRMRQKIENLEVDKAKEKVRHLEPQQAAVAPDTTPNKGTILFNGTPEAPPDDGGMSLYEEYIKGRTMGQ